MIIVRRLLTTIAVAVGLSLWAIAPAGAHDGHHAAEDWQVQQIGPSLEWEPAEAGGIVDGHTVDLVKPAGDTGVAVETTDLGLDVDAGAEIAVELELADGAVPDSGAIRLFYYDHPDADTSSDAPTATAVADGDGALSLTVDGDGRLGTVGITYDASNDSAGTVRASGLTVAGDRVSFIAHPDLPAPDGAAQTCEGDPGQIVIPSTDEDVPYVVDGEEVGAGTVPVQPDTHTVTAGDLSWDVEVDEATGCDTDDGDQGDQNQDSDQSGDDGQDVDAGTVEQTSNSAGELPNTGAGDVIRAGLLAAVLLAAGGMLFHRGRVKTSTAGGRYRA